MDSLNSNNFTMNPNQTETNGDVIMISGCSDIQYSADAYISPGVYDGAMTYCFLYTLKTYTAQNKTLTWRSLVQNMRSILANNGFDQTPQISSGKIVNLDSTVFF